MPQPQWKEDWKYTFIAHITASYLVSLNEKRIERIEVEGRHITIREPQWKEDWKVIPSKRLFSYTTRPQWKEDWKACLVCRLASGLIWPQWKEDWKLKKQMERDIRKQSLNEKRIERSARQSSRYSVFKPQWKEDWKWYFCLLQHSYRFSASMKRGLKV